MTVLIYYPISVKPDKAKHGLRGLELDLNMDNPPLDVSLRRDGVLMLIEESER